MLLVQTCFFLNLEKSWAERNKSRNVLKVEKEFTSQTQTNKKLFSFYKSLFFETLRSFKREIDQYLIDSSVPKSSNKQILESENIVLIKEFLKVLNKMPNSKALGNYGF